MAFCFCFSTDLGAAWGGLSAESLEEALADALDRDATQALLGTMKVLATRDA